MKIVKNISKRFYGILLLFFITNLVLGQDTLKISVKYYTLVNKADSMLQIKKYKKAAQIYTSAFSILDGKGFWKDKYNAACSYAMVNRSDTSFMYLNDLAKAGYNRYYLLIQDSSLKSLHRDNRWMEIVNTVEFNYDGVIKGLNLSLVKLLDSLVIDDQKWRKLVFETADTLSKKMVQQKINETDSINFIYLKRIVKRYGCPNYKMVGRISAHNFWLLMQHQDRQVEFQKKVLKQMRVQVKKGQFPKNNYAYLLDRVNINTGKEQIYGTQMKLNKTGTSYMPKPCITPDSLDYRRSQMNLSTEKEYIKIMNKYYESTLNKNKHQSSNKNN